MERNKYFIINYYDKQVFKRMIEKYAMEPMEATRQVLTLQTHTMLENEKYALWEYSADSIFELW